MYKQINISCYNLSINVFSDLSSRKLQTKKSSNTKRLVKIVQLIDVFNLTDYVNQTKLIYEQGHSICRRYPYRDDGHFPLFFFRHKCSVVLEIVPAVMNAND